MELIEDQPIQRALFIGSKGSINDFVVASKAGLISGKIYEVRSAGFMHGVEYVDVINIGKFNSVMFEKR